MSNSIRLTLIAAGLVEIFREELRRRGVVNLPTLERILARATVVRDRENAARQLTVTQQHVLAAVGLDASDARYASAPLSWLGQTNSRPDATLLHAQLVHFATGLTDVALLPVHDLAASEVDELMRSLVPLVRDAGFELLSAAPGSWYLHCARALQLTTYPPVHAGEDGLRGCMPTGSDARALRLLMTELQMALHDHPTNQVRQRNGLPALNAVWFWGAGALAGTAPQLAVPMVFADDAYVKGLLSWCGSSVQALVPTAEQALASMSADGIVVLQTMAIDQLEQNWLAPSWRALQSRRITQLVVRFGEWTAAVDSSQAWRFWKRPRPLADLDDAFKPDSQYTAQP